MHSILGDHAPSIKPAGESQFDHRCRRLTVLVADRLSTISRASPWARATAEPPVATRPGCSPAAPVLRRDMSAPGSRAFNVSTRRSCQSRTVTVLLRLRLSACQSSHGPLLLAVFQPIGLQTASRSSRKLLPGGLTPSSPMVRRLHSALRRSAAAPLRHLRCPLVIAAGPRPYMCGRRRRLQ
jgi:hypothetical protein